MKNIFFLKGLCAFASAWLCVHVCVDVCVDVCIDVCVHACVDVSVHVCVHACVDVCVHVCIDVCVDVCVHVCVHVCGEATDVSPLSSLSSSHNTQQSCVEIARTVIVGCSNLFPLSLSVHMHSPFDFVNGTSNKNVVGRSVERMRVITSGKRI